MGLKRIIKKGVTSGFQPKRWVGLEHVKENGKLCAGLVKEYFSEDEKAKLRREEAEAMTLKQVQSRKKTAVFLSIAYCILAVLLVGYAFYLWFAVHFLLPGAMSMIIAFLLINYSLRELMLYTQIRLKAKRISLKNLFHYLIKGFPA